MLNICRCFKLCKTSIISLAICAIPNSHIVLNLFSVSGSKRDQTVVDDGAERNKSKDRTATSVGGKILPIAKHFVEVKFS